MLVAVFVFGFHVKTSTSEKNSIEKFQSLTLVEFTNKEVPLSKFFFHRVLIYYLLPTNTKTRRPHVYVYSDRNFAAHFATCRRKENYYSNRRKKSTQRWLSAEKCSQRLIFPLALIIITRFGYNCVFSFLVPSKEMT